ncbi:MAG: hypothetical protein QXS21_02250 [Thermoproteota archaeon]|nr:hypothetical protein [Candidatus Brockarchaeota archaeon]MBO3801396.1 hypothetical protein [Candidatus Brockarchaeota archaeon]
MLSKIMLARFYASFLIVIGILIGYIAYATGSPLGDFRYYFEALGGLLVIIGILGWFFKLK